MSQMESKTKQNKNQPSKQTNKLLSQKLRRKWQLPETEGEGWGDWSLAPKSQLNTFCCVTMLQEKGF